MHRTVRLPKDHQRPDCEECFHVRRRDVRRIPMTPPAPARPELNAPRRPPAALAWGVCMVAISAMAVFRLVLFRDWLLPVAYGMPLVVNLWLRRRDTLWAMAVSFMVIAWVKNGLLLGPTDFGSRADQLTA